MTCIYCASELPAGALFCGECGRSVTAKLTTTPVRSRARAAVRPEVPAAYTPAAPVVQDSADMTASDAHASRAEGSTPATPRDDPPAAVAPFEYSGSETDQRDATTPFISSPPQSAPSSLPPLHSPARTTPVPFESAPARPRSTSADRFQAQPPQRPAPSPAPSSPPRDPASPSVVAPTPGPQRPAPAPTAAPIDMPPAAPAPQALLPSRKSPSPAPPSPAAPTPAPTSPGLPPSFSAPGAPTTQDTAAIDPSAWADLEPMEIDLEETRIVQRSGARFVLQFSTGESVSVSGTGLVGRNPVAEPGERFDSIVVISDAGKSVSKTHLEFGQDTGAFWITDRFSGNGTTVREPGGVPRRCDPGKRYRVTRGSRVDIGEQFFIVS